jgi:GH24 family phage-related lysozyme (muramidase)
MTNYGAFTLTPKLLALLKPHFEDQEGRENCIYPDSEGNPTVGIGHLLASAEDAVKLPFVRCPSGTPATRGEISGVWHLVKATSSPCRNLLLPDADIDELFVKDLNKFAPVLFKNFGSLGFIPQPAVIALYDMAFNLGGFLAFPRLRLAVLTQDWDLVAGESHRLGIGERRNKLIRALFLEAAKVKPPETQRA